MLAVLGAVVGMGACSRESSQPRYHVSGTVTYQGQPLPSGLVKFEPDVEKGGTGPSSYAPVKDGVYCTEDRLCAGPMKVRICGFDGIEHEVVKDGQTVMEETRLFKEYPLEAKVKDEDTVIDFVVPDQ